MQSPRLRRAAPPLPEASTCNSLLDLEDHGVHVLDVVEVAEHEGRFGVEAAGDDVFGVFER